MSYQFLTGLKGGEDSWLRTSPRRRAISAVKRTTRTTTSARRAARPSQRRSDPGPPEVRWRRRPVCSAPPPQSIRQSYSYSPGRREVSKMPELENPEWEEKAWSIAQRYYDGRETLADRDVSKLGEEERDAVIGRSGEIEAELRKKDR